MPRFEVVGIGRSTGRKRVRIYNAINKEDAIKMAASDGTIVDTAATCRLPDAPPEAATERQITFARDLGIKFSKDISKDDLSRMISEAVENEDDCERATIPSPKRRKRMGGMHEASGFCKSCQRQTLIRRKGTNHILHLILSIVTGGFWLIVWLLCCIKIGGWRCATCGSKTRRKMFG